MLFASCTGSTMTLSEDGSTDALYVAGINFLATLNKIKTMNPILSCVHFDTQAFPL